MKKLLLYFVKLVNAFTNEKLTSKQEAQTILKYLLWKSDPKHTLDVNKELQALLKAEMNLLYEEYGWEQIYKTYFIGFSKQLDKDIRDFIKSNPELRKERRELNTKIVDYLDKNAEDIYEKNMAACFGDQSKVNKFFKLKDNFVERQKTLSKRLIKTNRDD